MEQEGVGSSRRSSEQVMYPVWAKAVYTDSVLIVSITMAIIVAFILSCIRWLLGFISARLIPLQHRGLFIIYLHYHTSKSDHACAEERKPDSADHNNKVRVLMRRRLDMAIDKVMVHACGIVVDKVAWHPNNGAASFAHTSPISA